VAAEVIDFMAVATRSPMTWPVVEFYADLGSGLADDVLDRICKK
jgi:hypothetical protein